MNDERIRECVMSPLTAETRRESSWTTRHLKLRLC